MFVTENICVDDSGNGVIVDLDSALPFGERLLKGRAATEQSISHRDNDYAGLARIEDFLKDAQPGSEID